MRVEQLREPFLIAIPISLERIPNPRQCRINAGDFTCFGIPDFQNAGVGQIPFAGIHNLNYYDVMPAICHFQRLLKPLIQEIGYQEYDGALVQNKIQMLERFLDASAAMLRSMKENLTNYAQYMGAPPARRNEFLHAVREEDRSNAIVVLDRRKSNQG